MSVAPRLFFATLTLAAACGKPLTNEQRAAKAACRDAAHTLNLTGDGRSVGICEKELEETGWNSLSQAAESVSNEWGKQRTLDGQVGESVVTTIIEGALQTQMDYYGPALRER